MADDLDNPQGNGAADSVDGNGHADGGMIIDHEIDRELHNSYLTYAMSTIMDRALPDARDGLKP